MPKHPRPVRIAVPEARAQLADTVVDLVNLSLNGALIRVSYELRPGTVWPFVLELPLEAATLTGRVVRCQRTVMSPPDSSEGHVPYNVALTFDRPSIAAQRILEQLCGTAIETDQTTPPAAAHSFVNRSPATGSKHVRVLVVDDEESVRAFAERALREAGYEVALASNGPEALRIAEERGPFDVFVIDILMPPGMQGDELGRQLRERDLDVKVLYFTAYSDRLFQDPDRGVLWENEAFLDKPVTLQGLREAVSLLLFDRLPPQAGSSILKSV